MAEMTNKKIESFGNFMGSSTKLFRVDGQSAVNSDTLTVTGMTTIAGTWCQVVSDGTQGSAFAAGNVITITNSAAKFWSCLVWGT